MQNWKNDAEYMNLVKDILDNEEFKELKNYKHHGDNRFNHCIRVSYKSYLKAKKLNLDSKAVARAGLLHDFFLVNNQQITLKERIKVLITHPKLALINSKKNFKLSKLEENIILSHMFPVNLYLPKYKESILVNLVDDSMSFYERYFTMKDKLFKKNNKKVLIENKKLKKTTG